MLGMFELSGTAALNLVNSLLVAGFLLLQALVTYGGPALLIILAFTRTFTFRSRGSFALRYVTSCAVWFASWALPALAYRFFMTPGAFPSLSALGTTVFVTLVAGLQLALLAQLRRIWPEEYAALCDSFGWHVPYRGDAQTNLDRDTTKE